MKLHFFYFGILVLLGLAFAQIPITSCVDLQDSGDYVLTQDLSGSPIPSTSAGGTACIRISTSDVTLDCANHELLFDSNTRATAVLIEHPTNSPMQNIIVKNCRFTGYQDGLFAPTSISNSQFLRLNSTRNSGYGLYFWAISRSVIANNSAMHNADTGLYVALSSNNNQILNNTVAFNDHHGLALLGNGNTVSGTISHDNLGSGIFIIAPSSGNTITSNVAYRNYGEGLAFELGGESTNTVLLNLDYGNRDPNSAGSSGSDSSGSSGTSSLSNALSQMQKSASPSCCGSLVFLTFTLIGVVLYKKSN
ncbi:right-handed parallel beta-helix repeat-containing protein [Candidatus Micrarchaeota archaeon]|nr:right-handed parallel beta-helix repeat-containing protein [Candidatus Micrarchaeota archaeon]